MTFRDRPPQPEPSNRRSAPQGPEANVAAARVAPTAARALALQRTAGNRAVTRLAQANRRQLARQDGQGGAPATSGQEGASQGPRGDALPPGLRQEADEALKRGQLPDQYCLTNELTGYEYVNQTIIGQTKHGHSATMAASLLMGNPNAYFPFDVIGTEGEQSIRLGAIYDLQGSMIFLPNKWDTGNYVVVDQVSPTHFRFVTLTGHFDGAGGTIRFTLFERHGWVVFEQHGWAPSAGAFKSWLGPDIAQDIAWSYQAGRLAAALAEHTGSPVTNERVEKKNNMLH
jgi:hypothetical protein